MRNHTKEKGFGKKEKVEYMRHFFPKKKKDIGSVPKKTISQLTFAKSKPTGGIVPPTPVPALAPIPAPPKLLDDDDDEIPIPDPGP